MTRYVVQCGPGEYVPVEAPSPRAAAGTVAPGRHEIIVWYRTRCCWASWADGRPGRRTRYLGKVDERVAALLDRPG